MRRENAVLVLEATADVFEESSEHIPLAELYSCGGSGRSTMETGIDGQ